MLHKLNSLKENIRNRLEELTRPNAARMTDTAPPEGGILSNIRISISISIENAVDKAKHAKNVSFRSMESLGNYLKGLFQ